MGTMILRFPHPFRGCLDFKGKEFLTRTIPSKGTTKKRTDFGKGHFKWRFTCCEYNYCLEYREENGIPKIELNMSFYEDNPFDWESVEDVSIIYR